jgi:hypothetical protein
MSHPGESAYHELCAYTLELRDPSFIHQHVVDSFAAQHATEESKPIAITFALVGLYLHVELGYTGKEVQRLHMALAKRKQAWPAFRLPPARGVLTVEDVMKKPAGPERNAAIERWCASVWQSLSENRPLLVALLAEYSR